LLNIFSNILFLILHISYLLLFILGYCSISIITQEKIQKILGFIIILSLLLGGFIDIFSFVIKILINLISWIFEKYQKYK
jgi:hypothetical protein